MLRKSIAAVAVALLLLSSIKPSQAAPAPVVATGATAFGSAGYATVGFIGVVTFLVGMDLYFKMVGLKNWNGTVKKGVKLPFPY